MKLFLLELYVYRCEPINVWEGWNRLTSDKLQIRSFFDRATALAKVKEKWKNGSGWEGDIAQGPFYAPLPCGDSSCQYMVAWKETNGDTFIASPIRLAWLDGRSQDSLSALSFGDFWRN
jgi:hypothetical protein